MFFLMDQPSQKEFEHLSSRYEKMDIDSTRSMVRLLRVGSDLLAGFEKLLGTYHLSQGRFLILVIMNRNPDSSITPSALARKVGVTRATMTGLIKSLEKDNLISKVADDLDRRQLFLTLTPKGIRVLESILPDYYAKVANVMSYLSPEEKISLIHILEKVVKGLPFLVQGADQPDTGIKILPYTETWKDQIINHIVNIQQKEFHIPITAEDQPDLHDIPDFYQQGAGNFWVALEDDRVIGTISLKDFGNHQAALRKMFVNKKYRGPSFNTGKLLLNEALSWAGEKGLKAVYLGTTAKFLAAQRFYEKNHFREIDPENLPPAFPRMKVDTKFYVFDVAVQTK